MEQIINNLWLGSDSDHEKALAKGWPILVCAKDGPHGHRQQLQYKTHGAKKDKNYLWVDNGNVRHLNFIDPDSPHLIPAEMFNAGLEFIKEWMDKEDQPILCHCNEGHSRGPSMVLAYLRMIGEMPSGYLQSQKKFKTIYEPYDPMQGVEQFVRDNWRDLLYEGYTHDV